MRLSLNTRGFTENNSVYAVGWSRMIIMGEVRLLYLTALLSRFMWNRLIISRWINRLCLKFKNLQRAYAKLKSTINRWSRNQASNKIWHYSSHQAQISTSSQTWESCPQLLSPLQILEILFNLWKRFKFHRKSQRGRKEQGRLNVDGNRLNLVKSPQLSNPQSECFRWKKRRCRKFMIITGKNLLKRIHRHVTKIKDLGRLPTVKISKIITIKTRTVEIGTIIEISTI
jgi:hypothetical protein